MPVSEHLGGAMSHDARRIVLVLLALPLAVLAGCGDQVDGESATTSASPNPSERASGSAHVEIDRSEGSEESVEASVESEVEVPLEYENTMYVLSCGVVDPAKVEAESAGTAGGAGGEHAVHHIHGVDPAVLLAVPASGCSLVDGQEWATLMSRDAFVSGAGITPAANASWCEAALFEPDPAEGFDCASVMPTDQ